MSDEFIDATVPDQTELFPTTPVAKVITYRYANREGTTALRFEDGVHVGEYSPPFNSTPDPYIFDAARDKAEAKAIVIAFADRVTGGITKKYPACEVATWPLRDLEARAVLAGDLNGAVLLTPIAANEGITITALATRVAAKAAQYRMIVSQVEKLRNSSFAAIDSSTNVAELNAALSAAGATAAGVMAALGLS